MEKARVMIKFNIVWDCCLQRVKKMQTLAVYVYLKISFLWMDIEVPLPYSWSAAGGQCPDTCSSSSSAGFAVPDGITFTFTE